MLLRAGVGETIVLEEEEVTLLKSYGVCEVFKCSVDDGSKGIIALQMRTGRYYWIKRRRPKESWET